MTGEGIYYAVTTGVLAGGTAARAVAAGTPTAAGAAHRSDVRRLLGRHLKHTWIASRLSRRPAVVDAGIRAAGRSQRIFDDLVEIGLGDGRITPRLTSGLAAGLACDLVSGLVSGPASHHVHPTPPHARR
jgi:flavin-dependent dehydrogenase